MDLTEALRRLWARKFAVVLALILAAAVALLTQYSVSSRGLDAKRSVSHQSALELLVDTRYSALARVGLPTTSSTVTERTPLFADYAASPPLRAKIATQAGVALSSLNVIANTTETANPGGAAVSTSYNAVPAPHASNQILLTASDALPVIDITATAGSASGAAGLVNATVSTLTSAVLALETTEKVGGPNRIVLRPLGHAQGTTVVTRKSLVKSVIVGVVVLLVFITIILAVDGAARHRRRVRAQAARARETTYVA